jgi:hypothetical protein
MAKQLLRTAFYITTSKFVLQSTHEYFSIKLTLMNPNQGIPQGLSHATARSASKSACGEEARKDSWHEVVKNANRSHLKARSAESPAFAHACGDTMLGSRQPMKGQKP